MKKAYSYLTLLLLILLSYADSWGIEIGRSYIGVYRAGSAGEGTDVSVDTVLVGEEITFNVYMRNPKGEKITAYGVYLTFDDQYFELLPYYQMTETCLRELEKEGVPEDVLKNLKNLERATRKEKPTGEKEFKDIIRATIGVEQEVQFRSSILKHAKVLGEDVLNPVKSSRAESQKVVPGIFWSRLL
jgi:hypothetical protein